MAYSLGVRVLLVDWAGAYSAGLFGKGAAGEDWLAKRCHWGQQEELARQDAEITALAGIYCRKEPLAGFCGKAIDSS